MSTTRTTAKPQRPQRRRRRLRVAAFVPAGIVATALLASACTPATGTTQRINVESDGAQLPLASNAGRISPNGRFVVFTTAIETTSRFGASQVFRKDRTTGALTPVSVTEDGEPLRGRNVAFDISGDGTKVVFTNIVRDDIGLNFFETAFVRDLSANTTIPVAVTLTGQVTDTRDPDLSTDGRFVAFSSSSPSLVTGDTNGERDVFVRDLTRTAPSIRRVSLAVGGAQIPNGGDLPRLSADGRFVLFRTTQNLVGADTDDNEDVYVRDTLQNTTTFESLAGVRTFARDADISGDGRFVVFAGESGSTTQPQAFVRDRNSRTLTVISHKEGSTAESNNLTFDVDVSDDGRHVAFTSIANDLVSGDTAGQLDVFVSSSSGGKVTRVSLRPKGQEARRDSLGAEVADGGKLVLFQSDDAELVAGDTNTVTDVFLHTLR